VEAGDEKGKEKKETGEKRKAGSIAQRWVRGKKSEGGTAWKPAK